MDKHLEVDKEGEYSPSDLKFFQTPKFNDSFPKGFVDETHKSFSSQDSEKYPTNRSGSNFSDHFNSYKPTVRPVQTEEDDRVSTGDCKCILI